MITFEKSDVMLQDIMIERGLGEVIVFYAHFLSAKPYFNKAEVNLLKFLHFG